MELHTCPNCFTLYGDAQSRCPSCEADRDGEGARVDFDAETRSAVLQLGGLFGGILDVDDGTHVLWCATGVCLLCDESGLAWHSPFPGRVEAVDVVPDGIRVQAGRRRTVLALEDGAELG